MITGNRKAFLQMIAVSELGQLIIDNPLSDGGHKIIVGSTPQKLILMDNYADHPRRLIKINDKLSSTAAGKYQLLARYYDAYKKLLGLHDFSPESQDIIAIQQIKERGALPLIDNGNVHEAIFKVNNIWASLAGSTYGQHVHKMSDLYAWYQLAGGKLP